MVRYLDGTRPHRFRQLVENAIEETGARTVADLGGGANPMLSQEFVARHELRYLVVDVSPEQLEMTPTWCETVVADLSSPDQTLPAECDLVFSKWLLEHLADPRAFHLGVRRLLCDGGLALHFFPTLYSLPFLANRVAPETVSERILARLMSDREREGRRGKFPAYYRWCRGPTERQLLRFESLGFAVEQYAGYFGHTYFERLRPLHELELRLASTLVRRPIPILTSFAHVVLAKLPGACRQHASDPLHARAREQ